MKANTKMKIAEFGRRWTTVENIITTCFLVLAILFFFGYAIYSAAHNVKF